MTVVPPNMILDMQRDAAFQASMAKLKELAAKAGMSVADFWENWNKVTPEQAAQIAAADKQVLTQNNDMVEQMVNTPTVSDQVTKAPEPDNVKGAPPVVATKNEAGEEVLQFKIGDFTRFMQKMQTSQQVDPISNQLRQQALAETKQDDPLTNMVRTIGPKQQLR